MPPLAVESEDLVASFNIIGAMAKSIAGVPISDVPPESRLDSVMLNDLVGDPGESSITKVEPAQEEKDDSWNCFLANMDNDESVDLIAMPLEIDGLGINSVGQEPDPCQEVNVKGLQDVPHPALLAASKGDDKSKSAKNDQWSLRRIDQLRSALGYNMRVAFGDLPFKTHDEILSNLFSRVIKINGEAYPSASLNNLVGGYNRIIRRASVVRSLKGHDDNVVERTFCIKKHPAFIATWLAIRAAVQKSARDGVNKKTKKVEILTQCMEDAILADIDHQVTLSTGVQKHLVLYLMTHCGIRGGDELWELQRGDITVVKDCRGRDYVKFEERRSKNNEVNENKTNENQFRTTYYSYEGDFLLTVKQYMRHLPELVEGVKLDLFMQPIHNPASIVWNNRVHKVSQDKCASMLKDMLNIVNLPGTLISNHMNKSGRATLVTRMAARGVPDETGMLVTGHHTLFGYANYDRTKPLQQEAAVLVSDNPGLSYDAALKEVSSNFVKEKVIGTFENLNPLMDAETLMKMEHLKQTREEEHQQAGIPYSMVSSENRGNRGGAFGGNSGRGAMDAWHDYYDNIDWERELSNNPTPARALGGAKSQVSNVANHMSGIYSNCNIIVHVVQPGSVLQSSNSEVRAGSGAQSSNVAGKGKENEG